MHAYVDTENPRSNNVQWTIAGKQQPMWVRCVDRTAPLLNGSAPWNKDMRWVGIAENFVSRMESLDCMIVFQDNFEDSQHQLQNESVVGRKQEESSRQHFKQEQIRLKHFHHTLQLKQPDKCRQ